MSKSLPCQMTTEPKPLEEVELKPQLLTPRFIEMTCTPRFIIVADDDRMIDQNCFHFLHRIYAHGDAETFLGNDLIKSNLVPEDEGIFHACIRNSYGHTKDCLLICWRTKDISYRVIGLVIIITDLNNLTSAFKLYEERRVSL